MTDQPWVITIGHQIGSGGAYIGQKLAEQLGIPFLDHEILTNAAERLHQAEADLAGREQRLTSLWQSVRQTARHLDPARSLQVNQYVPTDADLFQQEADYIAGVAEKHPAIFLGRCGHYILRQHPRCFRLFVHAEPPARIQRLGEMYGWPPAEAEKMIDLNDRERAAYVYNFTKQNWLDPRQYDLCANTTTVGLDQTAALVLACLEAKKR
jgi:CMP/dCMP kinase